MNFDDLLLPPLRSNDPANSGGGSASSGSRILPSIQHKENLGFLVSPILIPHHCPATTAALKGGLENQFILQPSLMPLIFKFIVPTIQISEEFEP
jgi:hypothetical protein